MLRSYTLDMVTAYIRGCQIKCDNLRDPFLLCMTDRGRFPRIGKAFGECMVPEYFSAWICPESRMWLKDGRIMAGGRDEGPGAHSGGACCLFLRPRRDKRPGAFITVQKDWQCSSISFSTAGRQDLKSPRSGSRDENSGKALRISSLAESRNA